MYSFGKLFRELSTMQILAYITLLQLWWIAIWGIAYIAIEYYSQKSKVRELSIYILFILIVILTITTNPDLIEHL
jgi:hypothetical protein